MTFKGKPERTLHWFHSYHNGDCVQSPDYISSQTLHCISLWLPSRSTWKAAWPSFVTAQGLAGPCYLSSCHIWQHSVYLSARTPSALFLPYHVCFPQNNKTWFSVLSWMSHISQLLIKMLPMHSTINESFLHLDSQSVIHHDLWWHRIPLSELQLTGTGNLLTSLLFPDS